MKENHNLTKQKGNKKTRIENNIAYSEVLTHALSKFCLLNENE
jgi:hypothetical protein